MKKIFIKTLCLITIFSVMSSLIVFAQDVPASINFGVTSVVNPGEEAVITIDTTINTGFDIQGIQVDFEFSENFPELKSTKIIKNTTGWQTLGITKNNILAVGDIIEGKSQLVGKITFDVPKDAAADTEYVFTPVNAIVANASGELDVKLSDESITIVVAGGKKEEDIQKPVVKPEDTDDEKKTDEDKNTEIKDNVSDKETEENADVTLPEEKPEEILVWKNPFSDVLEGDWFYDGVRFVFERELMSGVALGEFAPKASLTRAMLVTILYRFDGSPDSMTYAFSDVSRKMWYTKSVDWAASTGIVNGVGNNMFAPDMNVTREQIAVIFYNFAKYKEMDLSAKKDLSVYSDNDKVSSWAQTQLEWAVGEGLISGKDNNMLDPSGNATRAEISVIIKRFIENIIEK